MDYAEEDLEAIEGDVVEEAEEDIAPVITLTSVISSSILSTERLSKVKDTRTNNSTLSNTTKKIKL